MLYLMRHGRTDWNAVHKLQGRTDVPLNELGKEMARRAREEYKDVNFDVCYCSPLTRARQTAEIFLEGRNIPVIYDERLIEMCFGECEGIENCMEREDTPIYTFFKHPEEYTTPAPGAESFEELFARTGEFLREVVDPLLEKGKDVLIIGHGAMNSSIVCQVLDMPISKFWDLGIENCKLKKLK